MTAPPPFSFWGAKKKMGVESPQGMPCHHAPFGAAAPRHAGVVVPYGRQLLLRCPKFFARIRSQNFDRCHSFLLASSVTGGARKRPPFHKGALGTGDADCRVGPAGLLAMAMVFCHSGERSDVGIRPFYDERGFGPPHERRGTARRVVVPYGWLRRAAAIALGSGAQRSVRARPGKSPGRGRSPFLVSASGGKNRDHFSRRHVRRENP